jgi:ATP-dependent helicase HrpA
MTDPRIDELRQLLPRCMLSDWVRLGARAARWVREGRPLGEGPHPLDRLMEQARSSIERRELRVQTMPRPQYPPGLPISARKDDIVAAIRAHPVVVIAGETGSGKTTQIPKMCLEAGLGARAMIGCTQPRRVAALSISRRIAEELDVSWGREVGCKIRFDDRSGTDTVIKLMTDGMLLAEVQGDPTLAEYEAIIIDEAHERSLNIDFLLGHLKNLLAQRPDLKVIITSATIDTAAFSKAFNDAPIIEVSGRTFPVEVEYRPPGGEGASSDPADTDFVDAAARECERLFYETGVGDVLIFLPGERDIRECADLIEGRLGSEAQVVPLFGRLSSGDQQQVFSPSSRRKVVIATNIAETSLTIPGIRFVIDSGLVRMSRYNARTRTRRLPVEAVSQSSANQRKGRAGRVEAGVCIRLYSEEDFEARSPFTQPEIQRANLAEVILRMKASRLGDIETFPFLNPPAPMAISGGYSLLQELGALDEQRELTALGRDLARLPIDPTLGRMLLQAQTEHAGRELLIIAAGLSIQDPRERPLDQREAADKAHRRFMHSQSDFLSLLGLWNGVHDQWESLRTQGARRKFCRQHFLSYLRMREWQDLHGQLQGALEDLDGVKLNERPAEEDAVHRCILAGLLGHVAVRQERNQYKGVGNRMVSVFPGSVLYDRPERSPRQDRRPPPAGPAAAKPEKTRQPAWMVCGEIVETSQLFARTLAAIDPQWIVRLAPHLCKVTHQNAHWSASAGRVLVEEKTTFHGLEVFARKVAYGNIAPREATAIFIRSALVEDDLLPPALSGRNDDFDGDDDRAVVRAMQTAAPSAEPRFMAANRALREKVENWQTRLRRNTVDLDQVFFEFYARHLENISSLHELHRLMRDHTESGFLCATEPEITGGKDLHLDENAFPDSVTVDGQVVPLVYAYAPGEAHDGVTVKLPAPLAQRAGAAVLEWAVPGLREAKIEELLRALPKSLRRELMPFPPKVPEIVREFQPQGTSFFADLARFLTQRYGVPVPEKAWGSEAVPAHLKLRFELLGSDRRTLVASRDLQEARTRLPQAAPKTVGDPPAWHQAVRRWERPAMTAWSCGDLPERITVVDDPVFPVMAWPGLEREGGAVNVRLFRTREACQSASLLGFQRLVELALSKDLAWVEKELRALARFDAAYAAIGTASELRESAFRHLLRHILPAGLPEVLTAAAFEAAVVQGRERIVGLVPKFMDQLALVLQALQLARARIGLPAPVKALPPKTRTLNDLSQLGALLANAPAAGKGGAKAPAHSAASVEGRPATLPEELAFLMPSAFLDGIEFETLRQLPRYLKALTLRAERAANNPVKDGERAKAVAPYQAALHRLRTASPANPDAARRIDGFRWLLEEYKVSLFAQELGTAVPVSPKRLDDYLASMR